MFFLIEFMFVPRRRKNGSKEHEQAWTNRVQAQRKQVVWQPSPISFRLFARPRTKSTSYAPYCRQRARWIDYCARILCPLTKYVQEKMVGSSPFLSSSNSFFIFNGDRPKNTIHKGMRKTSPNKVKQPRQEQEEKATRSSFCSTRKKTQHNAYDDQ